MSDHIEFDFSELTYDELYALCDHAWNEIALRQVGISKEPPANPECKCARNRRVLQIVPPIKGDTNA